MATSNPVFTETTFNNLERISENTERMSLMGTVHKTFLLLLLCLLSAGYVWSIYYKAGENPAGTLGWMAVGGIGGLVLAFATIFKKEWAPITAPLYAFMQGLLIGGISAVMENAFPGIIIQAVLLTFGTLLAMLFVYQSGLIQVTDKFRLGVAAATGGVLFVYLASFVLGLFGFDTSMIFGNSWSGILFSVFVIIIAALNFVVDFDFIEQGIARQAPKYMEWYGAFGLMVTLIWLYIEFVNLLSKARSR